MRLRSTDIQIKKTIEHTIGSQLHNEITVLRNECFPGHSVERSYFKQLPHFRYLAFDNDLLIGHMGVDHRVISVGNTVLTIFGVIDLCVSSAYRKQRIASEILCQLDSLAKEHSIDFLLLFADDHRLYEKNGFKLLSSHISWLRIDDHKNYGVGIERFEKELMIKKVGGTIFPNEPIDLLGYLF